MSDSPPIVLTIAGFDPSSGAGATADLKTIAAHGCYGVAAITALTVQSTQGVKGVEPLSPELVTRTLGELGADFEIAAVKIGMLGTGTMVGVVAEFLQKKGLQRVVLDPVLRASSGAELLEADGIGALIAQLLPLATVVTPNIDEAATLTGAAVGNVDEMAEAARWLHQLGARAVVVTGGHLEVPVDLLSQQTSTGVVQKRFEGSKVKSASTHGTGCAFSTAIACQLALGQDLEQAVLLAKEYVREAIAQAYPVGDGIGPLHHLFRFSSLPRFQK
jgi:hydroxymethylpyrimidine/phosphomethylpyrimidine kinase